MRINLNDPDALFIPLISDYGFKVVFGNERNTLFLRRALQVLIQSEVPIAEVSFDKNTFDAVVKDSRGGIYDLACVDENGTHFIVEMRVSDFLPEPLRASSTRISSSRCGFQMPRISFSA